MARVKVSTIINAPPAQVWDDVQDLSSHIEWMDDALRIEFTSPQHRGVGAAFACDTALGPFHVTDRIEVTEWQEGRRIGIRHRGVVKGTGCFTLKKATRGRTRFTWEERLTFPWWLGGGLASLVGSRALKRVWRKNLANLRARFET